MKKVYMFLSIDDAKEVVYRKVSDLADRLSELFSDPKLTSANLSEIITDLVQVQMELQDIEKAQEKGNAQ
jgi:hypothetical protein